MTTKCRFIITENDQILEVLNIPPMVDQLGLSVAQFSPELVYGTWIPSFDIEDCVNAYTFTKKAEVNKDK